MIMANGEEMVTTTCVQCKQEFKIKKLGIVEANKDCKDGYQLGFGSGGKGSFGMTNVDGEKVKIVYQFGIASKTGDICAECGILIMLGIMKRIITQDQDKLDQSKKGIYAGMKYERDFDD